MKQLFNNIIALIALGTISLSSLAQTNYHIANGVATSKKVEQVSESKYKVTLETYATGESTYTEPEPADIVLVLDVSGSMDERLGDVTALESQSYSYDSFGNNTYYVKIDGEYYPVYRGTGRTGNQTYYFLYFIVTEGNSAQKYFLYDSGDYEEFSSNAVDSQNDFTTDRRYRYERTYLSTDWAKTSSSTTLYTGVLYKGTRMDALKDAVKMFINKIRDNSAELPSNYDNQISIVKFGLENSSSMYYSGAGNHILYNNVSTVADFTKVTESGAETLRGIVDNLVPGGGTGTDYGLTLAKSVFDNATTLPSKDKKTVVLFTDGAPRTIGSGYNTTPDYYDPINEAKKLKDAGITVYTVGVFDEETDAIKNFMQAVSSEYPSATANVNNRSINKGARNTETDDEGKLKEFYFNADSPEKLEAIFASLAESSGGSTADVGSSTQVRDAVSSSFIVPTGDAQNAEFSVWKINRDGSDWDEDDDYDVSNITLRIGQKSYPGETDADGKTVVRDTVGVTGFDFSLDDSEKGKGDGNWVGERIPDPKDLSKNFTAGRKLVITFLVNLKEGVTGGDTQTNASGSGVYVYDAKTKTYSLVNEFAIPQTQLPINIKITKEGLLHGESATFKIMKIEPKMEVVKDDDGNPIKSKIDPTKDSLTIAYNALGKPIPNEVEGGTPEDDSVSEQLKAKGWKNFSKVVMTNKDVDNTMVEKNIRNLDPNYVYAIIEDDWSWSYTTTGKATGPQTTSSVTVNPFTFSNTKNNNAMKHAEAVTINHFAETATGTAEEEHYSSKEKIR